MTEGERVAAKELLVGLINATAAVRSLAIKRADHKTLEERAAIAVTFAKELARVFELQLPSASAVEAAGLAAADAIFRARKK